MFPSPCILYIIYIDGTPINAEVVPFVNYTNAVTFSVNTTYDCSVTPGNQPVWFVNTVQFIHPDDDIASTFARIGIFLEIISSNTTRLTITHEGRVRRLESQAPEVLQMSKLSKLSRRR